LIDKDDKFSIEKKKDFTIASDLDQPATYYLENAPVCFYCANLPTFMGERINLWKGGNGRIGITDQNGTPLPSSMFNDSTSFSDGKLEFATFSSVFHLIWSKSKRVAQAGGNFEFK
jgi:hypothetical protein